MLETIKFIGDGRGQAQDGHLNFHTTPELCDCEDGDVGSGGPRSSDVGLTY